MPSPRLLAIVLTVEHRRCTSCRTTSLVPNPVLTARLKRTDTFRASSMVPLAKLYPLGLKSIPADTPRERIDVRTTAESCHHCYSTYRPNGQLELFDPLAVGAGDDKPGRWISIDKAPKPATPTKPAIIPLTIEDFQ